MNSNTHAMAVDSDGDSDEFFDTISIPDSDTDSGLLNGEDLKEDFSTALRADAPFTGSYFCCSTDESAPNPALRVNGVGLLELPLSKGGARLITSVASPVRAAEGQNANSVWEVEASDLAVGDAAWQDYLANTILPSVSDQLGFAQFTKSKVQIELSKLMLFGPGSDSFMHRTEETRGTNEFGKLAIFLPSPFEGGQVKISRTSKHEAFDINVASVSSNTISVAWYNDDVVSETMPVTAGYQLVLIYRLVHTGSILTKPSLRYATDRSTSLGDVLGRWKKGDYKHLPSAPLLVLPLSKVYRPQSLKDGADFLEDPDAEIVASLLPVAHDHGFSACLANVVPSARRTGQQGFTLFNLERITDGPDPGRPLSFGGVGVPNNIVVQYEGIEEADANRSMRTGLVIFQDKDEMPIALALQGAESTFKHLSKHGPLRPTATNRQLARAVLQSLGKLKEQGGDDQSMSVMHLSVIERLLECAVFWRDVKLWKDILPYAHGLPISLVLPLFRTAFSTLTFDVTLIRQSIYDLIIRVPNLGDRLTLVEAIVHLLPNDNAGLSWANGAVDAILSSYQDSKVKDVPTLIDLAVQHAALALILTVISNVSELAVSLSDACSFLLELAKEIHRNKDAFSAPPKLTAKRRGHPQTTATKVIRSSIKAAIVIFAKGFKPTVQDRDEDKPCASRSASNVDQICKIFELCLIVNDPVPCRILLETISEFLPEEGDIKSGSSAEDLFEKTYLPLISQLNELLQSGGIDITEEPFQPTVLQEGHLRLPHLPFPCLSRVATGTCRKNRYRV